MTHNKTTEAGVDRSKAVSFLEKHGPLALSLVTLALALTRVIGGEGSLLKRLDYTTLAYLLASAMFLILRKLKYVALGEFKMELERVEGIANEAKNTARIVEDGSKYGVFLKDQVKSTLLADTIQIPVGSNADNPWKGQFGGKNVVGTRRLGAGVRELPSEPGSFMLGIWVESSDPIISPLTSPVQFFLSPTFANNKPIVPIWKNGKAHLLLKASEAFTVGALVDDGLTKLELDLSELESAPNAFRKASL